MKTQSDKRHFWGILLIFLVLFALVSIPTVFAASLADAVVPTPTWTPSPTFTFTPPPPTAPPPPTETPTLAPANLNLQAPTETPQTSLSGESNVPERSDSAAAAGSSILGFLLCAGIIIVFGLAALNLWARRRP